MLKMKVRECIVELAKELAAQSRNRVHTHESELRAAEKYVAELIVKLSASELEHNRSAQFEPERGGKLQCPAAGFSMPPIRIWVQLRGRGRWICLNAQNAGLSLACPSITRKVGIGFGPHHIMVLGVCVRLVGVDGCLVPPARERRSDRGR